MNPEPYHCLWDRNGNNRLDMLIALREYMEDLPKTKGTFTSTKVLTDSQTRFLLNNPNILYLAGTWEFPEHLAGSGEYRNRYINPHAPDASYYSMKGVECECGEIISRAPTVCSESQHKDNCPEEVQETVHEELHDMWLRTCFLAGHYNRDLEYVTKRLGVSEFTPRYHLEKAGISYQGIQNIGRMRMAKTMEKLSQEGEYQVDIGRGFGYSRSRVSEYISSGGDFTEDMVTV